MLSRNSEPFRAFYARTLFMRSTRTLIRISLTALLLSLIAAVALAQPDAAGKRAEAKRLYDEAVKLRIERTYQSYLASLSKFEESTRLYEEIGDLGNAGSSRLGVGLMKNLLGDRDAGYREYLKALEIFREIGHYELEARTLSNIASYFDEKGDKQKALQMHLEALPVRRLAADESGEAQTLNSIGSIYAQLGARQKALEYYNESLAIRRRTDDRRGLAISLNNIGRIYDLLGQLEKARTFYEESLTFRRELGDREGEAITLTNIGITYSEREPSKALIYYERSRALFLEIGLTEQLGGVINNMAEANLNRHLYVKGAALSREAIELNEKNGDISGQATALANLAYADRKLNRLDESVAGYQRALILARASSSNDLEGTILNNLMRILGPIDPKLAIFYGKQCVNRRQELRAAIRGLDAADRSSYLSTIEESYRFLADLLIESGRLEQANQVLQMLKEEEFSQFVRRAPGTGDSLSKRVAYGAGERAALDKYAVLSQKSLKAADDLRRLEEKKAASADGGPLFTAEDERELQRLRDALNAVNREFQTFLETELRKELGLDGLADSGIDLSMQARLKNFAPGTVMLTTVVTDGRYRVILTTPDIQVAAKTEITAAQLSRKIFEFRELLKKPTSETRVAGKQLYDLLIKPIEPALAASRAKTLVLSLDGVLRYIPFSALSPDGSTYLIEKYATVNITPQTSDETDRSRPAWTALGMGVSQAQSVKAPDNLGDSIKFAALPAIEDELKTIVRQSDDASDRGILPGRRFLNDDFTLRNLADSLARRSAGGKREFTVVHLASHFRLAPTWSDSFLLLGSGNILTLEDMSKSSELDFSGVELVTLSACNTASSDESGGRDVDGLAGLIQLKNGRSVLATLWEVSDVSTAKLMTTFYRQRNASPNSSKAEAVQSAQKTMLYGGEKPVAAVPASRTGVYRKLPARPFAHPYYWSSFVLIGNWR